jgi:hypothetical protein
MNNINRVLRQLRLRFIDFLVGNLPYAANLHLISTMAIDADLTGEVNFKRTYVDKGHSSKIEDCEFHFLVGVKYFDKEKRLIAIEKRNGR